MATISLAGVGKKYRVSPSRQDRLKEVLSFGKVKRSHDFWALEDIDLEVEPGTSLGILGRNGAGKSTLLKIISGIVQPSTGTVEVNGRLAALFGVGAGFNPEFTGRENVMLNGLLLGIEHRDMLERLEEIEAFADIGEFMNQPIRTYSSGMNARLGFAVAVNVEPDILVVDETLSTGDAVFKQAALQKMYDLRDSGTTILFVSHSPGMVKNFCTQAVLLHKGRLIASGDTAETLDRYEGLVSDIGAQKNPRLNGSGRRPEDLTGRAGKKGAQGEPAFKEDPALTSETRNLHHGTGEARISSVEVLDKLDRPVDQVPMRSKITVRVHLHYEKAVDGSSLGITLRNEAGIDFSDVIMPNREAGIDVFSTNTNLERTPLGKRGTGERVIVDFTFKVPMRPGNYSVSAFISYPQDEKAYLDRVDAARHFEITPSGDRDAVPGLIHLPTAIEIHAADHEQQGQSV